MFIRLRAAYVLLLFLLIGGQIIAQDPAVLIPALLVPLHHWLERHVLKYLTSHNRPTTAGNRIKNRLFSGAKGD